MSSSYVLSLCVFIYTIINVYIGIHGIAFPLKKAYGVLKDPEKHCSNH